MDKRRFILKKFYCVVELVSEDLDYLQMFKADIEADKVPEKKL